MADRKTIAEGPNAGRPLEELGADAIAHEVLLTAFCHELKGFDGAFAEAIAGRLEALLDSGELSPLVRKRIEGFSKALLSSP